MFLQLFCLCKQTISPFCKTILTISWSMQYTLIMKMCVSNNPLHTILPVCRGFGFMCEKRYSCGLLMCLLEKFWLLIKYQCNVIFPQCLPLLNVGRRLVRKNSQTWLENFIFPLINFMRQHLRPISNFEIVFLRLYAIFLSTLCYFSVESIMICSRVCNLLGLNGLIVIAK